MVGGLPKESTEDKYCDSIDGDELPRDPLSGSPGNPWYISPEGAKGNWTRARTGGNSMTPGGARDREKGQRTRRSSILLKAAKERLDVQKLLFHESC